MNPAIVVSTVSFLFTGLLFIALAIPLIQRSIPPNRAYGFRAKKAFTSESVWYDVNEYSARLMRNVGILIVAAVPLLLLLDVGEEIYVLTMVGIVICGTLFMIIRSYMYLNSLTKL